MSTKRLFLTLKCQEGCVLRDKGKSQGDWARNIKPNECKSVKCVLVEPLGDSGDGVTDGVQDTWSEGSHKDPLALALNLHSHY